MHKAQAIATTEIAETFAVYEFFDCWRSEEHLLLSQLGIDPAILFSGDLFDKLSRTVKRSGQNELAHSADGDADGCAPVAAA